MTLLKNPENAQTTILFIACVSGYLEHIGSELPLNKSSQESLPAQNGYPHDSEESLSSNFPGSIVDPHQQLLMVLSNIGYCKEELSHDLYNKYKGVGLQSRYEIKSPPSS